MYSWFRWRAGVSIICHLILWIEDLFPPNQSCRLLEELKDERRRFWRLQGKTTGFVSGVWCEHELMCRQNTDQREERGRPARTSLPLKCARGVRKRRKPPVRPTALPRRSQSPSREAARSRPPWPPPCLLPKCLQSDKEACQVPEHQVKAVNQQLVWRRFIVHLGRL